MALLHQAELRPSKIELITGWAQTQPWFAGSAGSGPTNVASFRFDDPDGEVGIETILVRAGDGPVLQVPLTYRGEPLAGGDAWLIGTMHHSVLGPRWVYDATGDPAYLAAVATAALTGDGQAEQYVLIDGERVLRESTAVVIGSGTRGTPVPSLPSAGAVSTRDERGATIVEASGLQLIVTRLLGARGAAVAPNDDATQGVLTGTWKDQPEPQTLVQVWVR